MVKEAKVMEEKGRAKTKAVSFYKMEWAEDEETATNQLLQGSEFFQSFVQPLGSKEVTGTKWMTFLYAWVVHRGVALLSRVTTEIVVNWKIHTLRSFLEVLCLFSVTSACYSLRGDGLFAIQIGLIVGMATSICNDVVHDVMKQKGKERLLKSSSTCTNHETALARNFLFGYIGLATMQSIFQYSRNLEQICFFTALISTVLFVVGEQLFCVWEPTRQYSYELQARWTQIGWNWKTSFLRSFIELLVWILGTGYIYGLTHSFWKTTQISIMSGFLICAMSGLIESVMGRLIEISKTNGEGSHHCTSMPYWEQYIHSTDAFSWLLNLMMSRRRAP